MSYISKIIASARAKKPSALKHTTDAKGNPKGKSHLANIKQDTGDLMVTGIDLLVV